MFFSVNRSLLGLTIPFLFNTLIPLIMSIWSKLEMKSYYYEVVNTQYPQETTFDFIIVGGGSAGSVLANRLSEHFSVLLLERGGEPNPMTAIPLNSISMARNPEVDYGFLTKPQKAACLGLVNNSCSWSRGKGLGGSSNINWQVYLRGHPFDYDNWANITGDVRWSYENVLPFFMKSEDYCIECEGPNVHSDPTYNPLYHGTNGYLSIAKSSSRPLAKEFLDANEWDGIMRTDLNAPYLEGCAPIVHTHRNGRRCSTKIAFIDPVRNRKTLTIRKYARGYRILFRGPLNEAYAVQYEHTGFHTTAFATKEIIISTGSIETPKLLMLSGIGPKDDLKSLNITVVVDSPSVGKNLQDHLGVYVGPFLVDEKKSLVPERDITFFHMAEFIFKNTGPFTQTGVHATSLWTSSVAQNRGESLWPDLQFLFSGIGISPLMNEALAKGINLRLDLVTPFLNPLSGRDGFIIMVFNERPKARGEITLISNDYRDDPIMDPKYFLDAGNNDIKVIVEGIKRAVYIAENAPSFKNIHAKLSPIPFPSCNTVPFRSDAYWECLARHFSISNFHYVGTAAMGKRGSPDAVVDSELRVIGTTRLRVIDASIMPDLVSVNTNGPAIMIGERGAQLILDTYLK